jgi:hypothetical protein
MPKNAPPDHVKRLSAQRIYDPSGFERLIKSELKKAGNNRTVLSENLAVPLRTLVRWLEGLDVPEAPRGRPSYRKD